MMENRKPDTQVESETVMNFRKKMNQSMLQQGELRTNSMGYMPGLDGLRAFAVFAVIAYHLNLTWAPGGLLGVSLFFVLSGYLITNILLTQWESSGTIDLKDFWLRRVRRLLPALFVMLAAVMFWVMLCAPERLLALKQEVLAAVFYTSNWYLIFHHVSYFESFGPPSPLGHLWSLAVEEQFYLFWPLLLGLGLRCFKQRKWIIRGTVALAILSTVAMALIYIPGHDPSRVYYGTDTRAFALLVGALLAMVWPSRKMSEEMEGKRLLALDFVGTTGLLVVLFMIVKTNQYQSFLYQGGLLIYSIASACAVAALAHPNSYLSRLFAWKPLRWLGECSYGIYLWHYPIIVMTSPVVNTEEPNIGRTLWQIGASILLATLSRYLIEEPIRYGRRKRIRRHGSGASWRNSQLVHGFKILISMSLIFAVLFISTKMGPQISAKDLSENQGKQNQTEVVERDHGGTKKQTQGSKTDQGETKKDYIKGDEITAIGDSLMIDVKPALETSLSGIMVDGQIGRQMYQAPDVISKLQKEGKLRKIVMIELGTNGSFTEKQLIKTLDALKGAKRVVLVNTRVPRPWEASVNETLATVLQSYPDITLIDWYSASEGHDDYFYPDGVHLNKKGVEAYSKIMVETLQSKEKGK